MRAVGVCNSSRIKPRLKNGSRRPAGGTLLGIIKDVMKHKGESRKRVNEVLRDRIQNTVWAGCMAFEGFVPLNNPHLLPKHDSPSQDPRTPPRAIPKGGNLAAARRVKVEHSQLSVLKSNSAAMNESSA